MAARLKELFGPRAAGSNVFLNCYGLECRVFGATAPVSAMPGESALTFTVHLPEGQDRGHIAVAVQHHWNGAKVWSGYVVELTRGDDGRVHMNLDRPWVPEGHRIAQVDNIGLHVTDVQSGTRFTTDAIIAKKHGLRHVPDGNLLLEYVVGTAPLDRVVAAATEHAEEKSARERLAEIEPKLRRVEAALAEMGTTVEGFGSEWRRLQEIERVARALLQSVQESSAAEALSHCTSHIELVRWLGNESQT